jgi:uncharacterized protein YjbI with pentapeptide repeats
MNDMDVNSFEVTCSRKQEEYKEIWRQHHWLYKVLYFSLGIPTGVFLTFIDSHSVSQIWNFCGSEMLGIVFTVLVLDTISQWRQDKIIKAQLLLDVASYNNFTARRAASKLALSRWHIDDTLKGADLSSANLEGADLRDFNFTESRLHSANLTAANLENACLQRAELVRARLTDAILCHVDFSSAILTHSLVSRQIFWDKNSLKIEETFLSL